LRGDAITARPEGRLWRLIRLVRRRPVFSTALAAGLVCATALVGGGLWLASERAADARAAQADRAATERAANEDLPEGGRSVKKSAGAEGGAARGGGGGRLGGGATAGRPSCAAAWTRAPATWNWPPVWRRSRWN